MNEPHVDAPRNLLLRRTGRACADAWQSLLEFFFPPMCNSCAERLAEGEEHFCSSCFSAFEPLPLRVCHQCGAPLSPRQIEMDTCPDCPPPPVYFNQSRAAYYYKGAIVDGVHALKFSARLELAPWFARQLFERVEKDMASWRPDGVIPVPLHFWRRIQRGYNQSEELARHFCRLANLPLWPDALRRTRSTHPQSRLKGLRRQDNVRGAFGPRRPELYTGKHVLLMDDVHTSGSTLNACAGVLMETGAARVTALTLCRAVAEPQ